MAPLPDNNTGRLFLDYTSRGTQHTMLLRRPGDYSTIGASATAYANIFAQRMFDDDSFYAARYAPVGVDFTLPIVFTEVPGVIPAASTNSWAQDPESVQLSFVFRGLTTGRRGRVEFFSAVPTASWPGDNRYNPGEAAVIDTLRTNFTNAAKAGGTHPLLTIGADEANVYAYVNIRLNGYWQTKQRSS